MLPTRMLRSFLRKLCVALSFGVAFVINPAYVAGCGSPEEEQPDFGEAEMLALLEELTAAEPTELEDGDAQYEIELDLAEAEGEDVVSSARPLFASSAYACGSRTFMKSAAACSTQTEIALEGTLSVRRVDGDEPVVIAQDVAVEGRMMASGKTLRFVSIDLEFEGGTARWTTSNGMDFALDAFLAQGLGDQAVDILLD